MRRTSLPEFGADRSSLCDNAAKIGASRVKRSGAATRRPSLRNFRTVSTIAVAPSPIASSRSAVHDATSVRSVASPSTRPNSGLAPSSCSLASSALACPQKSAYARSPNPKTA
ncbi:Uncharacterised protein [Mycobacteroides abscessus subsp. abscessus]|nr:Uncharacterised protein [Mycobacteroides abscessus subsp. abscessus]